MFLAVVFLIGGIHFMANEAGHPINCNTNPQQYTCAPKEYNE